MQLTEAEIADIIERETAVDYGYRGEEPWVGCIDQAARTIAEKMREGVVWEKRAAIHDSGLKERPVAIVAFSDGQWLELADVVVGPNGETVVVTVAKAEEKKEEK